MNHKDGIRIPERAPEGEPTCDYGSCQFRRVPGSKHCVLHHHQREDLYSFARVEIKNKLQEIRKHPDSRNLETELALIRHILENLINTCDEASDLIRCSGQILQLVDRVKDLLAANIKVGQITGELMTIEEVTTIAQTLVGIVAEFVTPQDLETVVERFSSALDMPKDQ